MKNTVLIILLAVLSSSAGAKDLIVHEWGTFTSFMGADGKRQPGMHEEEEPLPNFVYGVRNTQEGRNPFPDPGNDPCHRPSKVPCGLLFGIQPERLDLGQSLPVNPIKTGVTQKMETPVIYFYGDVGQKVNVEIDFPEGIISQYYPRATSYTPKFTDVTSLGPSEFQFNVELLSPEATTRLPRTQVNSIWNPARQVAANTIRVENEEEKFIFYRGVADFDAKFEVTSDESDTLVLTNKSQEPVAAAFVLFSDGKRGVIARLDGFHSSTKVPVPNLGNGVEFHQYVQVAKTEIAQALVKSGLYFDEAMAMVNTWEKSYFHTPGLRVLYVVPNQETSRILPLTISPQPSQVVRTLIGRVEVMTENQERRIIDLLQSDQQVDLNEEFGRFTEPKVSRLVERVQSSDLEEAERTEIINKLKSFL